MPYLTSSPQFLPARHRLVTAVASLIALLLLAAYIAFPAPEVSLASKYTAIASGAAPSVNGEVTDGAGNAVVGATAVLTFRAKNNRVISKVTRSVSRSGRFSVRSPLHASLVHVKVSKGRRKASRAFRLRRNSSLAITAAIPQRRSGLLPGLFPY